MLSLLLSLALSASAADVKQGAFASARASEDPALTTQGVATCIAVALHDPVSQVGGLAHIGAMDDAPALVDAMIRGMLERGALPARIDAQVIGGWINIPTGDARSTSPDILAAVKRTLARYPIRIRREETLIFVDMSNPRGPMPFRSLRLDVLTGALTDL